MTKFVRRWLRRPPLHCSIIILEICRILKAFVMEAGKRGGIINFGNEQNCLLFPVHYRNTWCTLFSQGNPPFFFFFFCVWSIISKPTSSSIDCKPSMYILKSKRWFTGEACSFSDSSGHICGNIQEWRGWTNGEYHIYIFFFFLPVKSPKECSEMN